MSLVSMDEPRGGGDRARRGGCEKTLHDDSAGPRAGQPAGRILADSAGARVGAVARFGGPLERAARRRGRVLLSVQVQGHGFFRRQRFEAHGAGPGALRELPVMSTLHRRATGQLPHRREDRRGRHGCGLSRRWTSCSSATSRSSSCAPSSPREPELVQRFRTEAVVLARLNHQFIASVYGLHRHGDDWFMAMEFVPGETLDARLKRLDRFAAGAAVHFTSMVLQALDYAHRLGVVHRDIKPANVIMTPDGDREGDGLRHRPRARQRASDPGGRRSSARSATWHPSRSRGSMSTSGPICMRWGSCSTRC